VHKPIIRVEASLSAIMDEIKHHSRNRLVTWLVNPSSIDIALHPFHCSIIAEISARKPPLIYVGACGTGIKRRNKNSKSSSFVEWWGGGAGLEPATPSLGGSCPILARLPALIFSGFEAKLSVLSTRLCLPVMVIICSGSILCRCIILILPLYPL
jgi:hypothetical protein